MTKHFGTDVLPKMNGSCGRYSNVLHKNKLLKKAVTNGVALLNSTAVVVFFRRDCPLGKVAVYLG